MEQEKGKKAIWRNIGYTFLCLFVSILAGTLLMTAAYSLPVGKMKEHVRENAEDYRMDHYTFFWAPGFFSTYLDIFTDSLMQNTAVFKGTGDPLKDAMNNMNVIDFEQTGDPLYASLFYDGEGEVSVNYYARYWHGYLVFLKPLLLFTGMSGIRVLNMMFQFMLACTVLLMLYRIAGVKAAVPFVLAVLSINPISTALCIQYATVYSITLISALVILAGRRSRDGRYWTLFLWIGIATAFFDLLTYPLVGLGINLILLLILQDAELKENFMKIIAASFAWLAGYAGMWAGKWLMAYLVTGENVFKEALSSVSGRISGDTSGASEVMSSDVIGVIWANVAQYKNFPVKVVLLILILALAFLIVFKKYRILPEISRILPFLAVSCYPLVWYGVLRNHSIIHFWFTHRNLSVTVMGIACMVSFSLKRKEEPQGK